jgi:hypothetical protein
MNTFGCIGVVRFQLLHLSFLPETAIYQAFGLVDSADDDYIFAIFRVQRFASVWRTKILRPASVDSRCRDDSSGDALLFSFLKNSAISPHLTLLDMSLFVTRTRRNPTSFAA